MRQFHRRGEHNRGPALLFLAAAAMFIGSLMAASVLAQKQLPKTPLDLNVANVKELAELPGIGPVTANAIVQFRQKSGPFRRVEDLLVVRGISQGKLDKIKPYVTVKPVAPAKPAAPTKPATPAKSATPTKPVSPANTAPPVKPASQ